MPSFILTVKSVSSNGLTVLKVSKILSNRNYCSNYSVICILGRGRGRSDASLSSKEQIEESLQGVWNQGVASSGGTKLLHNSGGSWG